MQWFLTLLLSLVLAACGGGGGGGSGAGTSASTSTAASSVSGVAAVGAAISGRIYAMDATGHERYVDTTDGNFSFNLPGIHPPMLLKAQWIDTTGAHTLYSFASADGTTNVTPLTHLAVSAAAGTSLLDAIYASPSAAAFQALQAALPDAIKNLQASLQPLLTRHAVTDNNFMTLRFVPNHTGMDALLDSIAVRYNGTQVTLVDKLTGAILLNAPLAQLNASVSAASWSVSQAQAATDTDVAINSNGTGLVVWTEMQSGHSALKARLMNSVDLGVVLSSADVSSPQVAFDAVGNATVLWSQLNNGRGEIWSTRFTAADGRWAAANRVSSSSAAGAANRPYLAVDGAGNAYAVWTQASGAINHFDVWGAQYVAGGNWSAPAMLTDGVNTAYDVRIAANPAGQGLMAWKQERGDGSSNSSQPVDIWARTIRTVGAVGTAYRVNMNAAGTFDAAYVFGHLAVAANASGGGAVLWSQRARPSMPMVVQAAMLGNAGWQAAAPVSPANSTDDCYAAQIAFDAAGNAMAVWQEQTDYGAYGGTNHYTVASGWGTASIFVDSRAGDTFAPSVAMDPHGNATVVWYRWTSTNAIDVMINRYLSAGGWTGAQVFAPVGLEGSMMQTQPHVVANSAGQTVVVWGGSQGASGI